MARRSGAVKSVTFDEAAASSRGMKRFREARVIELDLLVSSDESLQPINKRTVCGERLSLAASQLAGEAARTRPTAKSKRAPREERSSVAGPRLGGRANEGDVTDPAQPANQLLVEIHRHGFSKSDQVKVLEAPYCKALSVGGPSLQLPDARQLPFDHFVNCA